MNIVSCSCTLSRSNWSQLVVVVVAIEVLAAGLVLSVITAGVMAVQRPLFSPLLLPFWVCFQLLSLLISGMASLTLFSLDSSQRVRGISLIWTQTERKQNNLENTHRSYDEHVYCLGPPKNKDLDQINWVRNYVRGGVGNVSSECDFLVTEERLMLWARLFTCIMHHHVSGPDRVMETQLYMTSEAIKWSKQQRHQQIIL